MKPILLTSPELQRLVCEVQACLVERPANLVNLKTALENLLYYLATPAGRTDKNCRETDLFFLLHDESGFGWGHLPDEFQEILDDIGMQLHDTIKSPEIAENFESLPEQLLERVGKIKL